MEQLTIRHNWQDSVVKAIPVQTPEVPRRSFVRRGFAAAQLSRLTSDMVNGMQSLALDMTASNYIIRERARDLVRNNDFAAKFMLEFRTNVPGPNGYTFQSNVKELKPFDQDGKKEWRWVSDKYANMQLEAAFTDWGKRNNCTVSGDQAFRTVQDLLAQYWARDGEGFARLIADPNSKYGVKVQVIEPEAIDEFLNTVNSRTGNIIKMGVEIDEWRRPVAYYMRKRNAQAQLWDAWALVKDYEVIPAKEMLHVFDRQYVNQTRGISLLAQSMIALHMLTQYEEAALMNARVTASKMGWFYNEQGEAEDLNPDELLTDTETGEEEKILDAEPGQIHDIGNKRFQAWDPTYPTQQHEMFVNAETHRISAGLGISYASLTNDLGDTSYSSSRVGLIDEREIWKLRQATFAETFLEPLYEVWLGFVLLTKAVNLPFAKFDKFNAPIFVGRRWDWVDPLKDVMAKVMEREYLLNSITQILAEKGIDRTELWDEIAEEQAEQDKLGLKSKLLLDVVSAAVNESDPQQQQDPQAREDNQLIAQAISILQARSKSK